MDFNMTANRTLVGHKCAGVIKTFAEFSGVPIREAFDIFYTSNLYIEIRNGISDMHCRSDGYLAEELQLELKRAADTERWAHLLTIWNWYYLFQIVDYVFLRGIFVEDR